MVWRKHNRTVPKWKDPVCIPLRLGACEVVQKFGASTHHSKARITPKIKYCFVSLHCLGLRGEEGESTAHLLAADTQGLGYDLDKAAVPQGELGPLQISDHLPPQVLTQHLGWAMERNQMKMANIEIPFKCLDDIT